MYNITRGNTIPMKAILEHEEERFPVAVSTNISVRAYNEYRYIDAENVTVDQEEDGVLYFEIPPTLNTGIFGVEVKGNVNGVSWRTATDGVVKITGATQRNDGSEAVPEGDTYDITMKVQLYKQQSSDRAIEEHNSDEASHPYILGELERIEGEIPTLPEHIVTDANYVHTDNNYTTEEKAKVANTYTTTQTDEAIEQAKEDVSWATEEYDITEAGGIGTVSNPRGRVVYFSSIAVSYIRILALPHKASTGISFKVIGTPAEDTNNFVQISVKGGSIIFRTSNRPTIFKAGVTYKVEYTYISHDNLGCVYLESWTGGTSTAAYTGSYNDLIDKPTIPVVPTNVSAFNNDAGYITKSVNDLVNYYLKSEVYTKAEVANLIAAIQQFHYEIYASISAVASPAGNVLYLIGPTGTGSDKYEEYVYDSTKQEPWVKIGDTSIDLSGYYTSQQTDNAITSALNTALADYTTTAALTLLLAGKQDVINDLAEIRSGASAGATAYQKPQGGIPKTDLAQVVKDSLDKADSALQEDTLYEDANGHDYVEIGGMKWATKNIGANAVTDSGLYFQWGDIQGYTAEQVGTGEGKKAFTWDDYKFSSDAQGSSMTKYNSTDGKTVLELEDDAARANWGGSWRMPTTSEMQAFGDAVNAVWTDDYQGSGVAGLVCTDKTDNTKVVFFPAAGKCVDGRVSDVSSVKNWTRLLFDYDVKNAKSIYSYDENVSYDYDDSRYYGLSVRPILDTTKLKKDLDNKQNTLVSGTNIKTLNGESILGSGNINIDISGKEDKTAIEAPVNQTDATLPITTLATEVGKYYRLDVAVDTLAVTLPAMENVTTTKTVVLYLTGGTTPAVTISSTAPTGGSAPDVYYQDGYAIESGKTYEVNCLWNGDAWIVASVEIIVTNNGGE